MEKMLTQYWLIDEIFGCYLTLTIRLQTPRKACQSQ